MSVIFGGWKYILKNIWYVLPFAVIPAIFLALSLDYEWIHAYVTGFFTGSPQLGFLEYFCVWSFIRIDSWLGALYGICALVAVVFFSSAVFVMVEKHMRLGKRNVRGVFSQLWNILEFSFFFTLLFAVLYEVWVVVLSAVLFAISGAGNAVTVYLLDIVAYAALFFVLFYCISVIYLWFPCRLMTGFRPYDSFLYSYRLATGIRGRLILSYTIFYGVALVLAALFALLPEYVFYIVMIVLIAFLYLDFCIRMETAYFETDKLDREDLRHGRKEY